MTSDGWGMGRPPPSAPPRRGRSSHQGKACHEAVPDAVTPNWPMRSA